jgi:hypothetical protein
VAVATTVDHDDLLQTVRCELPRREQARQQLRFRDDDPTAGVGEEVHELPRCGCVVHRERRRPHEQRPHVRDVELRPVGQQQSERVATAQAELCEAARSAPCLLAVLAPRQRDREIGMQQRRAVPALLDGVQERVDERLRRDRIGGDHASASMVVVGVVATTSPCPVT